MLVLPARALADLDGHRSSHGLETFALADDVSIEELLRAVRDPQRRGRRLKPVHESTRTPQHALERLSARERAILQALADGLSTSEIAFSLGIAVGTARTQLRNIFGKLGVGTRLEAVALLRGTRPDLAAGSTRAPTVEAPRTRVVIVTWSPLLATGTRRRASSSSPTC